MAIGESKRTGLFSNFKGLEAGTFKGTVNTQHRYSEFETEPLIKKELGTGLTTDATLNVEVIKPVTRRLEDVARITKLLAKPGGVKWEAHQVELQTIQNELEIERAGGKNTFKTLLKSIGGSLVTGLELTASTLAQVAVSGTGAHQTPFVKRAYLHDGGTTVLGNIFAGLGLGDTGYVNAGALTIKGKTVVGRPVSTLVAPKQSGYRRDGNQARVSVPSSSVTKDWVTVKTEQPLLNVEQIVGKLKKDPVQGQVDGRTYEQQIDSLGTTMPQSSISANQEGVRDRDGLHSPGKNEALKARGPVSEVIQDGTYVPVPRDVDKVHSPGGNEALKSKGPVSKVIQNGTYVPVPRDVDGIHHMGKIEASHTGDRSKVYVPHVAVSLDNTYSRLVSPSNITSGSLPTSHLKDAAKTYNPTGSVQQWSGRDKVEFSDNQGRINSEYDGFRMTKQFHSSSNINTRYSGWIKEREEKAGRTTLTVQDRVMGKVSGQQELDNRLGGQTVRLRDKWSNKSYYDSIDTVSSAEKQFYWDKDRHEEVGLVPFEISSITPEMRYYMAFEATLDSFNDNFTGNWNGTQYVGRAENFYIYTGFDRQIDFSFKAFASRPEYLYTLYRKLNALAGTTAPTYKDGVFMRGTLTSVSIGDLLVDQKGFFKGIRFNWKQDYQWEIDDKILRVPLVLDVSINFTPIHDFVPESINENQDMLFFFGGRENKEEPEYTPPTPEQVDNSETQPVLKLPDPEKTLSGHDKGRYRYQGDGLYYDSQTGEKINANIPGGDLRRGDYTDYIG